MEAFFAWIVLLLALYASCYCRVKPRLWIPCFFLLLAGFSYFHLMSYVDLIICWIVWVALSAFILLSPLRRMLITKPFMKWFAKQQPEISKDEADVLKAGGLWWEKEFFTGSPDWSALKALPKPTLTEKEQSFLDNQVSTLCDMLNDWEIVHELKDLPQKAWDYIKQEGFLGLVIPESHGGHGFSAYAHSCIVAKIASRSYSAAVTVMVPNSLGPAEFILHYGTDAQKTYYLKRLAHGEEIPCFALTAPQAGSDATSISDRGVVCKGMHDGEEVLGVRLNFDKRYITLAPVATLIGLAFKLEDPDHLIGDTKDIGITLALLPANHPGVEIGKRHYPLNLAFMNGPLRGKDVFIPLEWVIGGVAQAGKGWQMMMECLSVGRGISLPALATATSQLCFRMTGAYALVREQFKRSLGEFEGIKEALARIGGFTYIAEATRSFTALAVDQGTHPSVASAITKYHLTELGRKSVAHAMDVHAGRGIQLGPRNYLGNIYDGMPTSITVEGANILTRNLIIFGQGALRAHPYLNEEITTCEDSNNSKNQKQFDKLALKHIGYILANSSRALVYGLTGGRFIRVKPRNSFAPFYRQLTRMSTALAFVTDITMAVLGAKLKIQESLSARLGDVLSHLYLATSVLHYAETQDFKKDELPFVAWAVQYSCYQMYVSFNKFFANFPVRWLAQLMRFMLFPFGRKYSYPSDTLCFKVSRVMLKDSELRDRLTSLCYMGKSDDDPTGRMETAMQAQLAVRPLQHKVKAALKSRKLNSMTDWSLLAKVAREQSIISELECQQLIEAERLRVDAIAVDEF